MVGLQHIIIITIIYFRNVSTYFFKLVGIRRQDIILHNYTVLARTRSYTKPAYNNIIDKGRFVFFK